MNRNQIHSWKMAFLMSIIIPVGLVAAFRIGGLFKEPATISETITLETISWNYTVPPNPSIVEMINELLSSSYDNDEISVTMNLLIGTYHEREPALGNCGYMTISVGVNATMTSSENFISSFNVVFYQTDSINWIDLQLDSENLSLTKKESGKYASLYLTGENYPNMIYARSLANWIFTSNGTTHSMTALYELTYYNGTSYKRLIQPFEIEVS